METVHATRHLACPSCQWNHEPIVGPLPEALYKGICRRCDTPFTFRPSDSDPILITINGQQYKASGRDKNRSLVSFIRDVANLPGTKVMCREGGCGTCVVAASIPDLGTGKDRILAVNSCLQPVQGCHGWVVETAEGIGNQKIGFHPIQERLADGNGTQCGYCTPGMVMSMYSLLKEKSPRTEQEIEDAFGGNICRCTGYRPILQSMKSFANAPLDIEDLCSQAKYCNGTCKDAQCEAHEADEQTITVALKDALWQHPRSLEELSTMLKTTAGRKVRLVAGDTGKAVFKDYGPYEHYISLRVLEELQQHEVTDSGLTLGACMSLSRTIEVLEEASGKHGYTYLATVVKHFKKIAALPVRNVASLAGNLMMKRARKQFASDVFVVLETVAAKINLESFDGETVSVSPQLLLETDMTGRYIASITLDPITDSNVHINTYKIMPRSQNARAYMNAGFRMTLDGSSSFRVLEQPVIVYGAVSANFIHAKNTEAFLTGKVLIDDQVLQGALKVLDDELIIEEGPLYPSPAFCRTAAVGLLYKTSGEAEYTDNIPAAKDQLYAHLVLSTLASATIDNIDATEALSMPGVVRFLTHEDIPEDGVNNCGPTLGVNNCGPTLWAAQEVLCSGRVEHAGQPIGIIVADSAARAAAAASRVRVTFRDVQTPILTIRDAVAQGSFFAELKQEKVLGDPEAAMINSYRVLKGSVDMGAQYHGYMENTCAVCFPRDDGMDVHASSIWVGAVQQGVAQVIGTKNSNVHVQNKRVGGSFGGKETQTGLPVACALAAKILNSPVRCQLSLAQNMAMFGGRPAVLIDYEVGIDQQGKLQALRLQYTIDEGFLPNDSLILLFDWMIETAYKVENLHMSARSVKTNKPYTTFMRGPGMINASFALETIMEHISKELGMDPLEIRKLNFYREGDQIPSSGQYLTNCNLQTILNQLERKADLATRKQEVERFNKLNRWKKKGLTVVPLKYGIVWNIFQFHVQLCIYHGDGSVVVTHGGAEKGQGINTKVTQVCAKELGIPMWLVRVQPTDTMSNSNSTTSSGSVSTELCSLGVIDCCRQLKDRLNKFPSKLPQDASWLQRVQEFYLAGGDLGARAWVDKRLPHLDAYYSYGAACTEVELDILTGQHLIHRVDMIYDCGRSVNPAIDIGQAEGAFVMGLGYFLMEKCSYDPVTGVSLSNTTWEYKPPTSQDIPVDFRVELLKDSENPIGVLGAKAVGEPPLLMSSSAFFALKNAVAAARAEGGDDGHFTMNSPATIDNLLEHCQVKTEHLHL